MTTGNFQDWTGAISEIGPIYPFVGTEVLRWILGVVFWIGWHVWNVSTERRAWEKELQRYGGKDLPGEEDLE